MKSLPVTLKTIARNRENAFQSLRCAATPNPAHRLHTDRVVRDFRHHVLAGVFQDLDQASAWVNKAPAAL